MAERFEARRPFYWTGFEGVRVVLGAILLTAAALNGHRPAAGHRRQLGPHDFVPVQFQLMSNGRVTFV
jgi:hypothetical protein